MNATQARLAAVKERREQIAVPSVLRHPRLRTDTALSILEKMENPFDSPIASINGVPL